VALNRQGRVSNFVPPVNALILAGMLWGEVSDALLVGWAGFVWLSSALRIYLYRRFDAALADGGGSERRWHLIWIGAYMLAGAVWGVGSVVMFPQDGFLIQAIMVIFILGMGAGGTASFAPYFPALVAYVVPLIVPLAVMLVIWESPPHMILGLAGIIFCVALIFLGRAGHRSFADSFRLGIQNRQLAGELTAAQARLEGALDSMSEAFVLFDAGDRLVESNNKLEVLIPEIQGVHLEDPSFETFISRLADSGRVRASVGRPRDWTSQVLRRCRSGELPLEIELTGGRWLMLNRATTADGGTVATFADITDLKQHEAEISESEQRFRDFTSAASDWTWELDSEGRFVHLSGRYSEVSGRDPDEYLGRRLVDFEPSENRDEWERLLLALSQRQPFRNIRILRTRDDDEAFHFLINGLPIFGADGTFFGYRGTGTDITAMVRAENRARLAQSQLFEAIESIPAGFVLFDEEGRLTLWNSHAPQYLPGADPLIVSGARFDDLMKGCAESNSIRDAEGREREWLDEQARWFAAPDQRREMALSDGRFIQLFGRRTADGGTVCVMTDISEIRRSQEELAEKSTFLQATLEGMGEGLVVLNAEGQAVLCNSRLDRLAVMEGRRDIAGLSLPEILRVIGADTDSLRPAAHDPDTRRGLDENLAERLPFQFEVARIGRQVLQLRADPMAEGGWVCVFTDITAERRALGALAESEDRYRRLTEASPDMIAVHRRGRFVFVNAAGASLLGVSSADDLVGRRVLDFVHSRDHDAARRSRPNAGLDDPVSFEEFSALRSDGRSFDAEAHGSEFLYQGEPSVLVIWRDITERKLAQAQLVQTSKLALLGEMAASMAHELNQPLNIIRMAADSSLILMEEGQADFDSHREEFERISNQTERMASIINHLRVFSRQDDASDSRFNPLASVDAAVSMVRDQYLLDGVEIKAALPKRAVQVRGQPIRLEQVVLNLLANARDVLKDQRAAPALIEVAAFVSESESDSARIRAGEIVITLSDNGGGIPFDVIDHVFEPFFTTKKAEKGTGLGLAIGYSIVSSMGGGISVTNGAKGAIFEIRLPLADASDRADTLEAGRAALASRRAGE